MQTTNEHIEVVIIAENLDLAEDSGVSGLLRNGQRNIRFPIDRYYAAIMKWDWRLLTTDILDLNSPDTHYILDHVDIRTGWDTLRPASTKPGVSRASFLSAVASYSSNVCRAV